MTSDYNRWIVARHGSPAPAANDGNTIERKAKFAHRGWTAFFVATLLAACAMASSAYAEWRNVTRTDRMTDVETKYAVVTNQDGTLLVLKRDAHRAITASVIVPRATLDPLFQIRIRVDKNAAFTLFDPGEEEARRIVFKGADMPYTNVLQPAGLIDEIIWNGSEELQMPEILRELARGTRATVEYRTIQKTIEYAEFELGDGVATFVSALDLDLSPNPGRDAHYAAGRAALAQCKERYFSFKSRKDENDSALVYKKGRAWGACRRAVEACAKQNDDAERFNACVASAFK